MSKMPFLRITLSLVIGIFLINSFNCDSNSILVLMAVAGSLLIMNRLVHKFFFSVLHLNAILYVFFFIVLGAFAQKFSHFSFDKRHFSNYHATSTYVVGKIKSAKIHKSAKYLVDVESIIYDAEEWRVNGKLLLKSKNLDLQVGDLIQFDASISEFDNQENPLAFDQKRYYNSKGIYHFTYSNEVTKISSSNSLILRIRKRVKDKIHNLNISHESKALTQAMLLGDKSDLGELDDIFRKTGTSHVLAISGLHVGIVATILFFLFNFLPEKYIKAKYAGVLIGVWFFCLISGAMPSTVRSSIMLTCFLIGKSLGRTGLSYNYCFAAAFFMLLNNPGLIWDVGFQFSFLAIFGILYFYDFIYKSLQFKGFLNYAWQLFSVSLAAQLMIAPLSLYYFHDFPLLFLITSLVAIPATFVVITFSSAALFLQSSTFSSFLFLEPILDWFISAFIDLLRIFSLNEYFVVKNLYPSYIEIGLFYLALFSLVSFFTRKNRVALITFGLSFISLFFMQFIINKDLSKSSITIYAHSSSIMIDVMSAGSLVHFYDNTVKSYQSDWITKNRRIKHAIKSNQDIKIKPKNQIIDLQDIKLGIAYNNDFFNTINIEEVDCLLIKNPIDLACLVNFTGNIIDYSSTPNSTFINNKQTIIKI